MVEAKSSISRRAFLIKFGIATAALLSGCTPTREVAKKCEGEGAKSKWYLNEEVTASVKDETLILAVDGIGPDRASIRGIGEPLQKDDEIIREVGGKWYAMGCIKTIDQEDSFIEVLMYPQLKEVDKPEK